MQNATRRKLLLGLMTLPMTRLAAAAVTTPAASEGPFYPTESMRFDDVDSDLVKVDGSVESAGGEIVRLGGRVLNRDGRPISAARVEIWQCDVNGRYLHRRDFGWTSRDRGFQGFGRSLSDENGRYGFRTIKPVPYSGRTPHIHVKVRLAGREVLTTQFYLRDHPQNARDWLYQRIPADQRQSVTMVFEDGGSEPSANLDIVI